jgi:hypothetical protein
MEKDRRKRLASLPFPEKIKILEKLRRVNETAVQSGLRKPNGKPSEATEPRGAATSTTLSPQRWHQ